MRLKLKKNEQTLAPLKQKQKKETIMSVKIFF